MIRQCGACGSDNDLSYKFCVQCGTVIHRRPAAPEPKKLDRSEITIVLEDGVILETDPGIQLDILDIEMDKAQRELQRRITIALELESISTTEEALIRMRGIL